MSGQVKANGGGRVRKPLTKPDETRGSPRLGRQDWIDSAWAALGRGTIEHVKVDRLARDLKVTRGSFYWHFRDRQDLMDAVLEAWFAVFGLEEAILPRLIGIDNPVDRLWIVYEHVIRNITGSQTIALRLWAHRTPRIRERLRREDEKRLRHYASEFRALKFDPGEAMRRARTYYGLVMSEYFRNGMLPMRERLARAREQHDLLTTI